MLNKLLPISLFSVQAAEQGSPYEFERLSFSLRASRNDGCKCEEADAVKRRYFEVFYLKIVSATQQMTW